MAQAEQDPAIARSLRLALAGTEGSGRLAAETEKRLRALARAKGFVEWDKVRPLARELDTLRQTIGGPLAKADPYAAVAQMRLLLDLAAGVFSAATTAAGCWARCSGDAGADFGRLWALLP